MECSCLAPQILVVNAIIGLTFQPLFLDMFNNEFTQGMFFVVVCGYLSWGFVNSISGWCVVGLGRLEFGFCLVHLVCTACII